VPSDGRRQAPLAETINRYFLKGSTRLGALRSEVDKDLGEEAGVVLALFLADAPAVGLGEVEAALAVRALSCLDPRQKSTGSRMLPLTLKSFRECE